MCSALLPTLAAAALLLAAASRAEAAPAEGLYQTRDGAGFDGRGMRPPAGNVLAGSATYGTTTLCSLYCNEEAGCVGISWDKVNQECQLLSSVASLSADGNFDTLKKA